MKTFQSVFLSGLGAVGSSYASRIYEMDPDCLKVIVNSERFERYTSNRYYVNNKPYDFHYITPESANEPADLILIAVKHYNLEQSIKDIKGFVGKDTIILSLLNGIISEDILGEEFGFDKVLYSFCVGTDAVRQNTNTVFTNIGKIIFGEKINKEYSPKVEAVRAFFVKAGIPHIIPKDMLHEMWWKFMVNVGINQISAVLKLPYGVFKSVKAAEELMKMASHEVVILSQEAGINLNDDDINEFIKILGGLSPESKTSMLQDIEAGRKTEVEIFAGTVIEMGKKYGVETPVNNILYKMIQTLEQINHI